MAYKTILNNIFQSIIGDFINVAFVEGVSLVSLQKTIGGLRPNFLRESLVRVGANYDAGYLIPNDWKTYDLLISPGVGCNSEFDDSFAAAGCYVIQIDPYANPGHKKNIEVFQGYLRGYESTQKEFVTLNSILKSRPNKCEKRFLQMDIEGYEYEVINSLSDDDLRKFSAIVIEFHNFGGLCYRGASQQITFALDRLLTFFFVAHLHPNNTGRFVRFKGIDVPDTIEITFLNKTDYEQNHFESVLAKHPLDAPCSPSVKDKTIPKSWLKLFG